MKVTITYRYENGNFDSEYKDFETFEEAEVYAEKEKINRGALNYWLR